MNEGQISGIGVKTVNDRCVGDYNRVIKPGSPQLTVLASTPIDCRMNHGLVALGLATHTGADARQRLASNGQDRGIRRSEERRGGNECVSTWKSWWSAYH